jgi:hypothetical protein
MQWDDDKVIRDFIADSYGVFLELIGKNADVEQRKAFRAKMTKLYLKSLNASHLAAGVSATEAGVDEYTRKLNFPSAESNRELSQQVDRLTLKYIERVKSLNKQIEELTADVERDRARVDLAKDAGTGGQILGLILVLWASILDRSSMRERNSGEGKAGIKRGRS